MSTGQGLTGRYFTTHFPTPSKIFLILIPYFGEYSSSIPIPADPHSSHEYPSTFFKKVSNFYYL
jgi:hypothetical protein